MWMDSARPESRTRAGHAVHVATGEDQRRRLRRGAPQPEEQAGDEARARQQGKQYTAPMSRVWERSSAAPASPVVVGYGAQRKLHGARIKMGSTMQASVSPPERIEKPMPQEETEEGVAEESEDDGGYTRKHVETSRARERR